MTDNVKKSIQCWYYDVTELTDTKLYSEAMAALTWDSRRRKAARFLREEDQRLCVGAGILAQHMLKQEGADDLTLQLNENGKPELIHCPSLHFNLSHSGTLAVCAVSDKAVGVDAEEVIPGRREIESICFQPEEQARIESSPDPDTEFTRFWTRKESYMKLIGSGFSIAPDSFSVISGDLPDKGIVWKEKDFMQYMICICSEENRDVVFRPWRYGSEI